MKLDGRETGRTKERKWTAMYKTGLRVARLRKRAVPKSVHIHGTVNLKDRPLWSIKTVYFGSFKPWTLDMTRLLITESRMAPPVIFGCDSFHQLPHYVSELLLVALILSVYCFLVRGFVKNMLQNNFQIHRCWWLINTSMSPTWF